MTKKKRVCTRCIMDNSSDDSIVFDSLGRCNYCRDALRIMPTVYFPNDKGQQMLEDMLSTIKKESADKPFDCLMGISGGLDSSYLAYLGAVKWGLRILAVHIDDGFDEGVAIKNITGLCERARIQLVTESLDTRQFNDLTRSFLYSGVPNLAIPQDNILFASLYKYAKDKRIRHFLSGGNFSLECILQKGNTYDSLDKKHIKDIHRRYGKGKINNLPLFSYEKHLYYKALLRIMTWKPLNYIDYNKSKAISELGQYCGFEYYGSKHLENKLTKFTQLYWLPKKFKVDKRTSHLSSMIISGQISRDNALKELGKPLYDAIAMSKDVKAVLERLQVSDEEFQVIMNEEPIPHSKYKKSLFGSLCHWTLRTIKRLNTRENDKANK